MNHLCPSLKSGSLLQVTVMAFSLGRLEVAVPAGEALSVSGRPGYCQVRHRYAAWIRAHLGTGMDIFELNRKAGLLLRNKCMLLRARASGKLPPRPSASSFFLRRLRNRGSNLSCEAGGVFALPSTGSSSSTWRNSAGETDAFSLSLSLSLSLCFSSDYLPESRFFGGLTRRPEQ